LSRWVWRPRHSSPRRGPPSSTGAWCWRPSRCGGFGSRMATACAGPEARKEGQ
jgi:hypothetical protein